VAVIGAICEVLLLQARNFGRLEQAVGGNSLWAQTVLKQIAKLGLQPVFDRDAESLLGPIYALPRHMACCDALEQDLGLAAGVLKFRRQLKRKLNHLFVEQRHACLDRAGHRHAVDFSEAVVDQVAAKIDVQRAIARS
jgi:hypothetical protein